MLVRIFKQPHKLLVRLYIRIATLGDIMMHIYKIDNVHIQWPSYSASGYLPERNIAFVHKEACIKIFMADLSVIGKKIRKDLSVYQYGGNYLK